jgi:putative phage-type endonuclease
MLNDLIDDFIKTHNNDDIEQRTENWYKLMGTTIGGSEVAALMGLSPYSSFYDIVKSKIDICKGLKPYNFVDNISCWWGTLFEDVIARVIEIDIGNKVKGTSICIQKYEGHRNSPDGYIVANFYIKNNKYHLWTTDLSNELIDLSMILLLEFKCPITRRITGEIPKYYKPQVLSGLAVSPIAHKGLFIDALFRKCSVDQLGNNPLYDTIFHKKCNKLLNPIAWGIINIYINNSRINNTIKNIYEEYFGIDFLENESNEIIDLGDINNTLFNDIMYLVNNKILTTSVTTVKFSDGRGDINILNTDIKKDHILFAVLPWKLFDISYVPVDREPNFLENIYPLIQKVHSIVKDSLIDNTMYEKIKIVNMCDAIYT